MAKIFSFLLLCLAYGQNFEYKMQQVSVWIEHRYATTEIGIWLKNTNLRDEQIVQLSYDLKRSDYIHDLHGKIMKMPVPKMQKMGNTIDVRKFFFIFSRYQDEIKYDLESNKKNSLKISYRGKIGRKNDGSVRFWIWPPYRVIWQKC